MDTPALVEWNATDQAKLDESLRIHKGKIFASAKEKWGAIASLVPEKSPKDCAARYRSIRIALAAAASTHDEPVSTSSSRESEAIVHSKPLVPRTVHRVPSPPSSVTATSSTDVMNLWSLPTSQSTDRAYPESSVESGVTVEVAADHSEETQNSTPQPSTINVVQKKSKERGWWRDSIAVDLLTQRPIKELDFAPFRWEIMGNARQTNLQSLFDGEVLACYMVSTGLFTHPVQKEPLMQSQARSLDSYLLQHFLTRVKVAETLGLYQQAQSLPTKPVPIGELRQVLDRIAEVKAEATGHLQDIAEALPGLTPLLERALNTNVGYGWVQVCRKIEERIEGMERLMASHAEALDAAPAVPTNQNQGVEAAAVLQQRLQAHAPRPKPVVAGRGNQKANAPVVHKAAQKHSKTNAPNFLLAAAPHLSAKVRMASGEKGWGASGAASTMPAWGGMTSKPGQTKSLKKAAKFGQQKATAPVTAWGAAATNAEPSKNTKSKKKKKKTKKELQGFAMKMG